MRGTGAIRLPQAIPHHPGAHPSAGNPLPPTFVDRKLTTVCRKVSRRRRSNLGRAKLRKAPHRRRKTEPRCSSRYSSCGECRIDPSPDGPLVERLKNFNCKNPCHVFALYQKRAANSGCIRKSILLAIFVVIGVIIALTCSFTPAGWTFRYNPISSTFLVQSEYVAWIFAVEVFQTFYQWAIRRGMYPALAAGRNNGCCSGAQFTCDGAALRSLARPGSLLRSRETFRQSSC